MNGDLLKPSLRFDQGTLVVSGIDRVQAELLLSGSDWKWDDRVSSVRVSALHYSMVKSAMLEKFPEHDDAVPAWGVVEWPHVRLHQLRDDQLKAVELWSDSKRGLIVMPTGTGKTEVALTIMQRLGVSTLVIAPVRDLMYQWNQRILAGLGVDTGVIGDNRYDLKPVSVTTYDSAAIHMKDLGNRFRLIIFDEAHHLPGDFRREAALMSAAPWRLGLTATPGRSDGRHADLDRLIGPTVFRSSIAEAKGNTLAEYEIEKFKVRLSDDEQSRYDQLSERVRLFMAKRNRNNRGGYTWQNLLAETGSDPETRQVQRAFYAKRAIEDRAEEKLRILEDIFRLHVGSRVLVFAGSNAMARDVSARFLIPCLLNHCGKRERQEILGGFKEGSYPAIVANEILDEGIDVPEVKVGVVVGGQASTRQAVQRLGRLLRKSSGQTAHLYEVVVEGTKDEQRSRSRRSADAYIGTRHRRRALLS